MSPIEFRNGSAIKECQAMEVSERICDFVIMSIDLASPVHRPDLHIPSRNRDDFLPRAETSAEA